MKRRFGTSLGSGPSVYISSREKSTYRGVILQSPFLSVVRIKVPVQNKLFFDMFPNIDRIERISCPVFVIHGKSDEVVPFEHGGLFFIFLTFRGKERLVFKNLDVVFQM
jgi:abhydrolase domain-containing protein 17